MGQQVVCFSSGNCNMIDKPRPGHPCTTVTPQNDHLDQLIHANRLLVSGAIGSTGPAINLRWPQSIVRQTLRSVLRFGFHRQSTTPTTATPRCAYHKGRGHGEPRRPSSGEQSAHTPPPPRRPSRPLPPLLPGPPALRHGAPLKRSVTPAARERGRCSRRWERGGGRSFQPHPPWGKRRRRPATMEESPNASKLPATPRTGRRRTSAWDRNPMKGKMKLGNEGLTPMKEECSSKANAKIKYLNSYRMEPYNKFQDQLVRDKAQAILTNKLEQAKYDADSSPSLCASLSEEILKATKDMGFDRYKYVVTVLIVEKAGQAINVASRWVWDVQRDTWISAKCETETFIALALIMACYYE
ncbi:dynein light chain Tctex-type protein 2 [Excalfactoria chinensis]|uniref:dynein light chain Tctex-type protein 2 n=1 Tax=Excalfactoria chinensis TaxID=46218 RepID=UPI003B3A096E